MRGDRFSMDGLGRRVWVVGRFPPSETFAYGEMCGGTPDATYAPERGRRLEIGTQGNRISPMIVSAE